MAVQKSKKSPSRRGMRRAHNALSNPSISVDRENGKQHLRHHVSEDGFYREKRIFTPKVKETQEQV